ncbi:vomeronasal type-2 receptor 26-like [Paroedura picta]|uniref:vomeronasal type-2 receptor 26-like n=1 Tax=Paroedura picta TaxID=143630 RepID=UPI0040560529
MPVDDPGSVTKNYQHILALAFAVKELNENPNFLPNTSLGLYILNSYGLGRMTFKATLSVLSAQQKQAPNFSCDNQQKFVAVIGGRLSETSAQVASILNIYKTPQDDKKQFPSIYQMVPDDAHQYRGVVKLLHHFQWTWIGLLAMDDDMGNQFLQRIIPLLSENSICFSFIYKITKVTYVKDMIEFVTNQAEHYSILMDKKVNVFYVYGELHAMLTLRITLYLFPFILLPHLGKVWIVTSHWDFESYSIQRIFETDSLHGALSFAVHSNQPPGFQEFLKTLHKFLRKTFFNNSVGESIQFDHDGELVTVFDVTNWVTFSNGSFARLKVGRLDPQAPSENELTLEDDQIVWHRSFNQCYVERSSAMKRADGLAEFSIFVIPVSVCNDACQPGFSKSKKEEEKFCCYDCTSCPEGMVSENKDMDSCVKCPNNRFPSESHHECLLRVPSYLSYKETIGIIFVILAVSFSLVTSLVLGTFMKYKNTPIVKANNRNLTYILLLSLLLCFLSSLMFIGKPGKLTYLLRQITFSLIICVALSSILAKTITVILAFMATKPGSHIRRWVGKKLAYSIVLFGSLIHVVICTVWVCISPPFPQMNMNAQPKEIILECNEGSAMMFYFVLGYLGFLATVSFTVAFLARKLPSSFNEAKFITFSMLVFCSVWFSFIPTYLSSKGKSMVAVEIFSILSSAAGLLVCIFSPKCYIILLKPEMNIREQIIRTM